MLPIRRSRNQRTPRSAGTGLALPISGAIRASPHSSRGSHARLCRTSRSTRSECISLGCLPGVLRLRSWARPTPICMRRLGCIPGWRAGRPKTCLPPLQPCGRVAQWQLWLDPTARQSRRSSSMVTETRLSTQSMAIRSLLNRKLRRTSGHCQPRRNGERDKVHLHRSGG